MAPMRGLATVVLLVLLVLLVGSQQTAGGPEQVYNVIFPPNVQHPNSKVKTDADGSGVELPSMGDATQLETFASQDASGGERVEVMGEEVPTQETDVDQGTRNDETTISVNAESGSRVEKVPCEQVANNGTSMPLEGPHQGFMTHTDTPQVSQSNWTVPHEYKEIAGLGYYKVHRDRVPWETARRRCTAEGAHLLVINSPLEAAAVVATSGLPGWNWVGFDDFAAEGEYVTLHGTTLDEAGYRRWARGEPTADLRCGVANEVGLLGTGTCALEKEYICELRRPNENTREERPSQLPMGYRPLGNLGVYRVHWDRVPWEAARRRCEAEGAHLFVPSNDVEAAAVLRTSGLPGWLWVGFDDFDNHGQYVNFDDQQLKTSGVYSKFAPNEPDERIHCGVALSNGELGTGTCDLKREYICEMYKHGEKPDPLQPSLSPPPGYVKAAEGNFYKVHRDSVQWETARRRCQTEGAHLVVINSQAEADAVLKTSGIIRWFWVGFDDFEAPGEYITEQWTRLEDSGYVNWAQKEPTKDLSCGVAMATGLLGTGFCHYQREYICEWEEPSTEPSPPPSPHPAGYHPKGGLGLYKVHRDRVPWETARRRCEAEGAHLVVIDSAEEADAVLQGSGLPDWFWVGFDDFDAQGEYVTLQGTLQEAEYGNWAPEEPVKNLRCGVARGDGLLGTGNCKLSRGYICELNS